MPNNLAVSRLDLRSRITQLRNQKGPIDPNVLAQILSDVQTNSDLIDGRFRSLASATFGLLPDTAIDGIHINNLSADKIITGTLTVGGVSTTYPQFSVRNASGSEIAWLGIRNDTAKTITAATNASPIVITTSGVHGYSTGDRTQIAGVLGNTAANSIWTVTVVSTTTFSLQGSTGNGAYTSGGTSTRIFEGGWFKALRVGGSSVDSAVFISQNDGTTSINGATFTLTRNGGTTTLNNVIFGQLIGLKVADDSTTENTTVSTIGWTVRNRLGNPVAQAAISVDAGSFYVTDSAGAATVSMQGTTGGIAATSLQLGPSASAVIYLGTTAATASAGAGALPATPQGFINVTISGTNRKIPYYAN